MKDTCFTCRAAPAGYPENPYSAYCPDCQPVDTRMCGRGNGCAVCGHLFGGLSTFDKHQDVDYRREPVIICRDPAVLGLNQDEHGVWHRPMTKAPSYWTGPAAKEASGQSREPHRSPEPPARVSR